ncbi:S-adenosyl-L-methionine-dependent methyltransferase [Serendipita vermifera]|nr:S-adenosyl-L-methionine-dependent methyltransferase [Serendipita vermifera]
MNFYKECAGVLAQMEEKKGSINSLLSDLQEKDRKRAAALVIETIKYQPVLLEVIQAAGLLQQEKKILKDKNLVLLLVHDLLLAKGIQAGDGPIKQAIMKHKTRLNAEFVKVKVKKGAMKVADLVQTTASNADSRRWIRVNTLRASRDEVLGVFQTEGYVLSQPSGNSIEPGSTQFWQDSHIPYLFSFSPDTRLQDSELFRSGKIILQDKASCFPAFVLNPPSSNEIHVIDATAAPGNKTSHLSAITRGKGRITAFERDRKRFQTLKKMLERAGATNVITKNLDFLSVDPFDLEYSKVTHILLDPSCSGSGIVNRLDYLTSQEAEEADSKEGQERLEKLSAFQLKILQHAMKFPALQRLVYSTCSIHTIENEQVVLRALESEEARVGNFELATREQVIPTWHRRGTLIEGMDDTTIADSLIRCLPEDGTNGFFVACLVRKTASLNKKRKADELDGSKEEVVGLGATQSATQSDSPPSKKKKKKKKNISDVQP